MLSPKVFNDALTSVFSYGSCDFALQEDALDVAIRDILLANFIPSAAPGMNIPGRLHMFGFWMLN